MSFIGRAEHRLIHFLVRKPKSLVVIAAVVFFILFLGLESLRAQLYEMQVADYRQSARVQSFNDSINRLVVETEKGKNGAGLCNMTLRDNIAGYNNAYKTSEYTTEALLKEVHDNTNAALPSPAFRSLLQNLPHIASRVRESEEIQNGLEKAVNLTNQDNRMSYCLALLDVLSEVYFLPSISKPEGVAALSVGQVENFQTNTKKAQTKLKGITPPAEFLSEHTSIIEICNRIALHLREDENDLEMFSRRIELQTLELDMVLRSIHDKSMDLQKIPGRLYLETEALRRNKP